MRGKGQVNEIETSITRITPAYAGKRSGLITKWSELEDHPRVCGEKYRCRVNLILSTGSPPRMRGKAAHLYVLVPVPGITPAYAGKSILVCIKQISPQDHPRVCGEKEWINSPDFQDRGSPPRMRGKVGGCIREMHRQRITPAYAGKSVLQSHPRSKFMDHPRVCGEKRLIIWAYLWAEGSPPRMRGKARFDFLSFS